MSTTNVSTPATAYARPVSQRGSLRWLWIAAGAVVVLAGVGIAAQRGTMLRNLFVAARADAAFHEVRELDLAITLTEDGELKPGEKVEIKCDVEGQSTILFVVAESSAVKAGDLLVELTSQDLVERLEGEEIELNRTISSLEAARQELDITRNENTSNIKKAEIALQVAQLDQKKYEEGDFNKSLQEAEINIEQARMEINQKRDEIERNRVPFQKGFVTSTQMAQLEFDLKKAEMNLKQRELAKDILLKYEQPKDLMQKRAAVEQAEQELEREKKRADSREKQAVAKLEEQQATLKMRESRIERGKEQIAKCKMFAPCDGIVQYPSDGDWRGDSGRIKVGEKVYAGQTLVVLPDTRKMLVSTRVHEAERHRIHEGMTCLVRVPAVPGQAFRGRIDKITTFADTANRWLNPELKEHTTEIVLEELSDKLSPGDSAEIEIMIDHAIGVLAVPAQCVFARGRQHFVFRQTLAGAEPVEVKLGRSNTTMVEITEGLKSGAKVLLTADDELLAMLPAPRADNLGDPKRQKMLEQAADSANTEKPKPDEEKDPAPPPPPTPVGATN